MSFWDINQFLAEEERIEFSLSQDAYYLDFLDATKEGVILKEQTITAPIWMVNTLFDYLQLADCQLKVNIPEDLHIKSLDRINSFRTSHRGTVQHVRTKAEMPFLYEIYDAIKRITVNEGNKMTGEQISGFLQEKGKLIINRASGIFEQTKVDSITNNYSKFESQIFKITRNRALEYHNWKTA